MRMSLKIALLLTILIAAIGCATKLKKEENHVTKEKHITAADILGNPEYLAISYGGYRQTSRDVQPTIPELKEDMKILSAMGVKILRTYNVQLQHAPNLLKAISELKNELPNLENQQLLMEL